MVGIIEILAKNEKPIRDIIIILNWCSADIGTKKVEVNAIIVVNAALIIDKPEVSKDFFTAVQNKMHWAAHGHTAAEIIYSRVNADKTHMGLTSWLGKKINK